MRPAFVRAAVHIHGLSDEVIFESRVRDPDFQSFTGEEFFQHAFPHERSDLSHWRERLGKKLELLLADGLPGWRTRPARFTRPQAGCSFCPWHRSGRDAATVCHRSPKAGPKSSTSTLRNVLIIDRLFAVAELLLGGDSEQKVRIVGSNGRPS